MSEVFLCTSRRGAVSRVRKCYKNVSLTATTLTRTHARPPPHTLTCTSVCACSHHTLQDGVVMQYQRGHDSGIIKLASLVLVALLHRAHCEGRYGRRAGAHLL